MLLEEIIGCRSLLGSSARILSKIVGSIVMFWLDQQRYCGGFFLVKGPLFVILEMLRA